MMAAAHSRPCRPDPAPGWEVTRFERKALRVERAGKELRWPKSEVRKKSKIGRSNRTYARCLGSRASNFGFQILCSWFLPQARPRQAHCVAELLLQELSRRQLGQVLGHADSPCLQFQQFDAFIGLLRA